MLLRLYALAGSVFSSYVTVPCWFCMSTSGSPVPPRGCVPSHPEDLALAAGGPSCAPEQVLPESRVSVQRVSSREPHQPSQHQFRSVSPASWPQARHNGRAK